MLLRRALVLLALAAPITAQGSTYNPANPESALVAPGNNVGGEVGHGSWSARIGYFDVADDGDGNPFLDEDLTVIEPVFLYQYNVSEDTTYSAQLSFDNVSSASIERLSKFDDQSGATGDFYIGADLGISHRQENGNILAGRFHASTEYDYLSLGLGGSLTTQSDDQNRSITYSLDAYLDSLDIIRFDGTQDEGSDNRTTFSGSVGWYQVLTPTVHAELGLTAAHQSGFLETPYNAIVIEDGSGPNPNLVDMASGTEVFEALPDSRMRTALHGRVRKLLGPNTAFELGGRIYDDDWGIQSYTIEPRLYQNLGSEDLRLRLRYRLYDQTASDYYSNEFLTVPEFGTQDSDLGEFQSETIGLKLIWDRSEDTTLDFSIDMIDRDDGLDQFVFSFGWNKSF